MAIAFGPLTDYERPAIAERTFHDAEGREIPYGSRWRNGSPREDSYSVTSSPERFAPVHDVAGALIEHLARTYAVTIDERPEHVQDLLHPETAAVRAVRVEPDHADAATLTFVFTSFPGIRLHAGLLQDLTFPSCGCDACDETWESSADELERKVFAVVQGGFSEGYRPEAELPVWSRFAYADGWTGSSSRAEDFPRERFAAVADALIGGRAWSPWLFRS